MCLFFLTNFSPLHPEILSAFRVMPAVPSLLCQGTTKSEDTLNGATNGRKFTIIDYGAIRAPSSTNIVPKNSAWGGRGLFKQIKIFKKK